jgi:hypothetical protein
MPLMEETIGIKPAILINSSSIKTFSEVRVGWIGFSAIRHNELQHAAHARPSSEEWSLDEDQRSFDLRSIQ